MILSITDVNSYLAHDSILPAWQQLESSSETEQTNLILLAEKDISSLSFIGKRLDKSQPDIFPRDLSNVLLYIQVHLFYLDNYDDIYRAYSTANGVTPDRVKNAICEQIKWLLLTDDFLMEQTQLQKFSGAIRTDNAQFSTQKKFRACERALQELDPFLVKNTVNYYAFNS